jgi:hypothetical protein
VVTARVAAGATADLPLTDGLSDRRRPAIASRFHRRSTIAEPGRAPTRRSAGDIAFKNDARSSRTSASPTRGVLPRGILGPAVS